MCIRVESMLTVVRNTRRQLDLTVHVVSKYIAWWTSGPAEQAGLPVDLLYKRNIRNILHIKDYLKCRINKTCLLNTNVSKSSSFFFNLKLYSIALLNICINIYACKERQDHFLMKSYN